MATMPETKSVFLPGNRFQVIFGLLARKLISSYFLYAKVDERDGISAIRLACGAHDKLHRLSEASGNPAARARSVKKGYHTATGVSRGLKVACVYIPQFHDG